MERRNTALGLLIVVGVNVFEGTNVPYLLPDDVPSSLIEAAQRTASTYVHGSNYNLGGTAIAGFSDDRWR